jgi:SNF2 family DNA or RNA helicase
MTILHGNWIPDPEASYFFIWGETWHSAEAVPLDSGEIYPHPFSLDKAELIAFLAAQGWLTTTDINRKWRSHSLLLPTQKLSRPKNTALPLLSRQSLEEIKPKNLSLTPWLVEGISFTPSDTLNFFQALPLGSLLANDPKGEDLIFWLHNYRWLLDLIARHKFLPDLRSFWYPLLDSTVDQARLAVALQTIPPICLAYSHTPKQTLLLDFLAHLLDGQIRHLIEFPSNLNKDLPLHSWLQSLSQANPELPSSPPQRLDMALYNWTLPLQEYLGNPDNSHLSKNQFRVCLRLEPPTAELRTQGEDKWTLFYYLQALDNPDFLVDAARIWHNPSEHLLWKNRLINNAQETLLKGLGLASRLYAPIKSSLQEREPEKCLLDSIQVYEFLRSISWQLQDTGLGVIFPEGLQKGAEEKRLGVRLEAAVISRKGERLSLKSLLNYQLKLVIGEQVISQKEFAKLLAQKSPIVEINGQWLALQPTDVKAAQAILSQATEPVSLSVEDALRIATGDSRSLAKLPVVDFQASGILEQLLNTLTNNQTIEPITHPAGFQGELRAYQARGVGWLAFLEQWGLGACLADDMGLGKTPQLIAFLLHLKSQEMLVKPTLIICPTSVLNNWEREVQKFAPSLSTLVHHGENRAKGKSFVQEVATKALVITSYPLLQRDISTLEAVEWQGIVLDEAQNIKNPQAKQSQAVRKIKAGFRVALTGTPVENRLAELWSILDFLNPGFLGSQQFFQRRFAIPIEKYGDRQSLYTLRSLARPFILRRLKTDKSIIQDLPEKQEMNVFCGLSSEQAKLYQTAVEKSLEEIETATGIQRHGLVLTLLIKLKQICNHPAQFLKEESLGLAQRSGKLLRLEEMLEEVIEEGDRALIFTQFAEWGKLLQPYLKKQLGKEVLFLYGAIPQKQRLEMIDRFQKDPQGPPLFILSLKAGGTGLNLTRANHVFHVDRWWNPAVENQATDRAFRIGQKQAVQVHKFICSGTLEEKIHEMIESKKQLAEQTVDAGEQWLTQLDTEQLRNLLLLDREAIIDPGS